MPNRSMTYADEAGIEQTVRQVLGEVLKEASDSLLEAIGDPGEEEESETSAAGDASLELGSMKAAKTRGESLARAGRLGPIIRLLKKSRQIFRAAVRSAKAGRGSFNRWVNGLSNFNPAKWAIKALPDIVVYELVDWLASQGESAASGRTMAGTRTGDTEPEEIEQVVRRVLSEALTETDEGLPAH